MIREIGIFEHDKSMREIQNTIDLNFTASIRCARLAFKSLQERDSFGYIININSVYGHAVAPIAANETIQIGVYPGTKYAITASSEVMRMELNIMKNYKVRVSSVSPGVVHTNLFKAGSMSDETENILFRSNVLKPENIADAIAYLLSTPPEVTINELTIRATGAEL
jgi:NADP-dependent 3-hydroxy acid dehydrogenase YdfG